MRSSTSSCSGRTPYRSAALRTRPLSMSCCITAGPMPSISMAPRLAKCVRYRSSCAGHSAPVQRSATPSSSRTTGAPHTGHVSGRKYGPVPAGRLSMTTSMISGMISPALRTSTVSPMRMSFWVM